MMEMFKLFNPNTNNFAFILNFLEGILVLVQSKEQD
jgi:hypothetical protein